MLLGDHPGLLNRVPEVGIVAILLLGLELAISPFIHAGERTEAPTMERGV